MIEELHSACVAYDFAPVRKESGESSLLFLHQTGSGVQPTPVLTKISLSGTTLSQANYASNGGTAPNWTFSTTPSETSTLLANVGRDLRRPALPLLRVQIGGISTTPLEVPLSQEHAEKTVQVTVAFERRPAQPAIASDPRLHGDPGLRAPAAHSRQLRSRIENPPCA